MHSYLDYTFLNNTVYEYLIFFLVLLTSFLVIKLIKRTIFRRVKTFVNKRRSGSDDFVSGSLSRTLMPILYFSAFYLYFLNYTIFFRLVNKALLISVKNLLIKKLSQNFSRQLFWAEK